MDSHELQQENQALTYRNDKLKANYRKLQMNLSEKEERIKKIYQQNGELEKKLVIQKQAVSKYFDQWEMDQEKIKSLESKLSALTEALKAAEIVMDLMKVPTEEAESEKFYEALEKYNDLKL